MPKTPERIMGRCLRSMFYVLSVFTKRITLKDKHMLRYAAYAAL